MRRPGGFVVKQDFGAFVTQGLVTDDDGPVAVVVGDPLAGGADRDAGLAAMRRSWLAGADEPWREARGTFAAVFWDPQRARVTLVADAMGLRPLYYAAVDGLLWVSSSLRVLEELPGLRKTLCPRGAGEVYRLGHNLADRTPYAEIFRVEGGHSVTWERGEISRRCYFAWDAIAQDGRDAATHAERLAAVFKEAIGLRCRDDRSVVAHLSGGLDTRVVGVTLRGRGMDVSTYGFGVTGSKEDVYAAGFAQHIGIDHQFFPMVSAGSVDWAAITAETLLRSPPKVAPSRPHSLWTGDNGSFVMGLVHLSERLLELARAGNDGALVDAYLSNTPFLARGIRPELHPQFDGARAGIEHELSRWSPDDPAKRIYLFYLLNEARHILDAHFEGIDLHQLDLHVPFCDAAFIAEFLRGPLDAALGHRLYHVWMQHLDARTAEIAWQTYPGHEPCPLDKGEFAEQWTDTDEFRMARRARALRCVGAVMEREGFPHQVFSRTTLRFASWLFRSRLRELGYLFRALAPLRYQLNVARGRLSQDDPAV